MRVKISELFQFLHHAMDLGVSESGGDFLLTLSDASLKPAFRGPGKNKLYGDFTQGDAELDASQSRSARDRRQRWFMGTTRNLPKDKARFWKSKYDRESLIEFLDRRAEFDPRKDWGAVLRANGYEVAAGRASEKIADLLLTGLENLQGGNPNIDDKPWDPSLANATAEELAIECDVQPRISDLGPGDITVEGDVLILGGYRVNIPRNPKIPRTVAIREREYTTQIAAVLCAEAGIEGGVDAVRNHGGVFLEDFDVARRCYYLADVVRQLLKDTAVDGEEEFNKIKEDAYSGVRPTYRANHVSPYEKMNATLIEAVNVPLTQSHISSTTGLFGSTQRQGVVHMLVNDKKLRWVENAG